ncbi:T4 1 superfamily RNA ligase [Tupanvirus soda lake]|uniref:T4 1 superfamily RNA ligase n=2 Tax=Tupanvirus TaxID=2094720 RepID=A0A6N1NT89_9VIRU|nr:T4 1 superfamily RNA ligase [Tupanvirus soda lake]QKU34848.1 T4 1 superfamily RNA ligase [Tupanvirus soda lake]
MFIKMANYLEFQQVSISNEMREKFIKEAKGMGLNKIIQNSKGSIRPVFHQAVGPNSVYLVLIVGSYDNVLIKLANECGFPRGFPVLWVPGITMQYFGFYPKFSNDERQTADDLSEYDGIVELSFFKKWSGFLSQVIAFEIGEKKYWTITSKNSANCESQFIQDAKRLFDRYITKELVNKMIDSKLHICAEVMSKNDQVHGSRVLSESPIVTAIGSGKFYDLSLAYDKKKDNDRKFVKFFDNIEIVNFCQMYGLPCDSSITINDASVGRNFITELSKNRDFMTDKLLEELVKKHNCSGLLINKGTVAHSNILGECLEGLVIKLKNRNKTTTIKKYKFANYTIRTMLLREVFDKFTLSYNLLDRAKNFVDYWCVSEAGKKYWYDFALQCFMNYKTFVPTDPLVGLHIEMAESVSKQNSFDNIQDQFGNLLESLTNGTVIICIGPIGSGKTTFANELASKKPDEFISIDGDKLDLGMDLTMKLSKERNDYTRFKIIHALMKGKIPIISTGGGVLFSAGRNQSFSLRNQILNTLGISCKIIVCVSGDFNNVVPINKLHNVESIYSNTDIVKDAVTRRVTLGEWKIDSKFKTGKTTDQDALNNFTDFIAKKSSENSRFAESLLTASDFSFGYPSITAQNYGVQSTFDFTDIFSKITPVTNVEFGKFSQIRLLTLINDQTVGHITWKYDSNCNIKFSLSDFNKLASLYPENVSGRFIKITSIDGKCKYTFVVPASAIHSDGSTHITVDSGCHAPKETGTIVRALNVKQKILDLPAQNGKIIKYDLTKLESLPCNIHMLGVFGI